LLIAEPLTVGSTPLLLALAVLITLGLAVGDPLALGDAVEMEPVGLNEIVPEQAATPRITASPTAAIARVNPRGRGLFGALNPDAEDLKIFIFPPRNK
jgi:hypothetical protein